MIHALSIYYLSIYVSSYLYSVISGNIEFFFFSRQSLSSFYRVYFECLMTFSCF